MKGSNSEWKGFQVTAYFMCLKINCILVFYISWWIQNGLCCPVKCSCKWRSGKQLVECINVGMSEIPTMEHSTTQIIDFRLNTVDALTSRVFLKSNMLDLQKIYLSKCGIKSVHKESFYGLTNLVELDLENNEIVTIHSEVFLYIRNLMKLVLSGNPISVLESKMFYHLRDLTQLHLENCAITIVENDALAGLDKLQHLRINGNNISSIEATKIFPKTLKDIELYNNPWHCDCHLLDLKEWHQIYFINSSFDPLCHEPFHLQNLVVWSLSEDEFSCKPEIRISPLQPKLFSGSNITLQCEVRAVPAANIRWFVSNMEIRKSPHNDLAVYKILENGDTVKKSVLFVANVTSDKNEAFSCTAENSAGVVYGTVNVTVLKRINGNSAPRAAKPFTGEHIFGVLSFLIILIVLILMVMICVLLKFKQGRKNVRNKKSVESDSQNQTRDEDKIQSNIDTRESQCSNDLPVGYLILPSSEYGVPVSKSTMCSPAHAIKHEPDVIPKSDRTSYALNQSCSNPEQKYASLQTDCRNFETCIIPECPYGTLPMAIKILPTSLVSNYATLGKNRKYLQLMMQRKSLAVMENIPAVRNEILLCPYDTLFVGSKQSHQQYSAPTTSQMEFYRHTVQPYFEGYQGNRIESDLSASEDKAYEKNEVQSDNASSCEEEKYNQSSQRGNHFHCPNIINQMYFPIYRKHVECQTDPAGDAHLFKGGNKSFGCVRANDGHSEQNEITLDPKVKQALSPPDEKFPRKTSKVRFSGNLKEFFYASSEPDDVASNEVDFENCSEKMKIAS